MLTRFCKHISIPRLEADRALPGVTGSTWAPQEPGYPIWWFQVSKLNGSRVVGWGSL